MKDVELDNLKSFAYTEADDKDLSMSLKSIVAACPNLECINLSGQNVTDDDMLRIARELPLLN